MRYVKYNQKSFVQVWDSFDKFKTDYNASQLKATSLVENDLKTIYFNLYANYGNSPITNRDETQFKYKCWAIISQYGDEWKKKLSIQASLKAMTEDEIMKGNETIVNHANNPSVAPTTEETGALGYVDDQNHQKTKLGKVDALTTYYLILNSNITKEFIDRFKTLFAQFVDENNEAVYCNNYDNDDYI